MNDSIKQQSVKLIAMYLPQFHCIPENDEFWGKGFTDWVTVKNAKPLFSGHQQPRVPLNTNYYDLSLKENIVWQAKLANEYGIYGLGIYHYWFNNEKNLLTKPAEIIMENKEININYCFAWDNISWKRSWDNVKERGNAWAPTIDSDNRFSNGPSILIPYILGDEEVWRNHYNYLLPFFKDKRYIKVNNKPIFLIYHFDENIFRMCKLWDDLARKDEFNGVSFVFRYVNSVVYPSGSALFKYEPAYSGWTNHTICDKIKSRFTKMLNPTNNARIIDYDIIWNKILKNAKMMNESYTFHSGFVSYDDTPRRGSRGIVVKGATPEKFEKYLYQLLLISQDQKKKFIFLTAWNEWGEGAYLEPDTVNKYAYAEAVKKAIEAIKKRNDE